MNMKVQLFCAEILCASVLFQFAEMVTPEDTTQPLSSASVSPPFFTTNPPDEDMTTNYQSKTNVPDNQSESSAPVKPSTSALTRKPTTTTNSFFLSVLKRDCLQLVFVCSGLIVACAVLLISICILAIKVCHLSKQLKTLRVNREEMGESGCLVNLTENKSEAETRLSNTSQEKLKNNGTTVEEEGITKKEAGDLTASETCGEVSLPSPAESASLKPQDEATTSEPPAAAATEPSEGAEQPKETSE